MTTPRSTLLALAVALALGACGRDADPADHADPEAPDVAASEPDEPRVVDGGRIHPSTSFIRAPDPGVEVRAIDDDSHGEPALVGVATTLDPTPQLAPGTGALVFSGHLLVPAEGLVTFTVDSSSTVVFDVHGAELVRGTRGRAALGLAAGYHPFELSWVAPDDDAPHLDVTWQGPGIDPGPIPPAALFR